jgi:hypothetical protein
MAEEAGAISYWHLSKLKAFEALVRADEREQALEQPEERYTYGTPLLDVFTKPAPVETGDTLFRQFMSEADKAGITHWPTPPAAQRQWVGLKQRDMPDGEDPMFDHQYFIAGMAYAANILMKKNT